MQVMLGKGNPYCRRPKFSVDFLGLYHRGAKSDVFDFSPMRTKFDIVADLDGSFKEQDQTGNKIVDDAFLSAI